MNRSCLIPYDFQLVSQTFPKMLYFLCIANAVLAILATAENSLVILSIWRAPSLRSQSNVLLSGLALSDLTVGLIVQPSWIAHKITLLQNNCFAHSHVLIVWLCTFDLVSAVTFVNICSISFDLFLALTLHLRYHDLVTIHRLLIYLDSIWIVAAFYAVWTQFHRSSGEIFLITSGTLFSLLTLGFNFEIIQIIRRHQKQIQTQLGLHHNGPSTRDYLQHKKSLGTMTYILVLFLLNYLPCLLYVIIRRSSTAQVTATFVATGDFLATYLYCNSCLNPLLYCWRVREIRKAVKETLKVLLARQ